MPSCKGSFVYTWVHPLSTVRLVGCTPATPDSTWQCLYISWYVTVNKLVLLYLSLCLLPQFVVFPFVFKETKGSYPFAKQNGLNVLNGIAHLWKFVNRLAAAITTVVMFSTPLVSRNMTIRSLLHAYWGFYNFCRHFSINMIVNVHATMVQWRFLVLHFEWHCFK